MTDEKNAKKLVKILEICNQLSLVGLPLQKGDIELIKFQSGFASDIFRVKFLKPNFVPESVVIKLYNTKNSKEQSGYEIINSQLNNLLVGQSEIGPKILMIRDDALVMEYLTGNEQLTKEHDADLSLREDVARKLAQFHALEVPIPRNNQMNGIVQLFNVWLSKELIESIESGALHQEFIKNNFNNILKSNFKAQVDLVYGAIKKLNQNEPALVFSHSDFNHSNILVVNDEVKLIDFDYSMYFFRGADLGRYFIDCTQSEQFHSNELISEQEITNFIRWYQDESGKIDPKFGSNPKNSIEQILTETKVFALYFFLKDCIFCLHVASFAAQSQEHEKVKMFLTNANQSFGGFLSAKERFVKSGLVL